MFKKVYLGRHVPPDSDFLRYRATLIEWRGKNPRVVDYIMGKAEQDGDLTLEQFLELCAIADGD